MNTGIHITNMEMATAFETTGLNNACACARSHGPRWCQRSGRHNKPWKNGDVFKKFRMAPGLWWKGKVTLKTVERNLYTSFLDHWSTYFFVHRGLKLVQLVKTARKHYRGLERWHPSHAGFWILFTSILLFFGAQYNFYVFYDILSFTLIIFFGLVNLTFGQPKSGRHSSNGQVEWNRSFLPCISKLPRLLVILKVC